MNHLLNAHTANPDTAAMSRLSVAERLFIWGFRSLTQQQRPGSPTRADLQQVFEHFSVVDSIPSIEALLQTFDCTAHSCIELHIAGCCCLSTGEYNLLQAVSAVQHEDYDTALIRFEQWLPPVAATWVLSPTRVLTTIFTTAGLTLPHRDDREIYGMPNIATGPVTLH
jgi:hypothetical protein